jgi:hypothetical protein
MGTRPAVGSVPKVAPLGRRGPGLPDSTNIFEPKIPNWVNFGGLAMENVGIFYGVWSHFAAIWYIFCPFGIFCGNVVYFPPFWYVVPRKIWQPCSVRFKVIGSQIIFTILPT